MSPRVGHDRALVGACRLAAGVSAVSILALLLFYAVELRTGGRHLFGPLSDVGTVGWDLLLVVVVGGLRPVLGPGPRAGVLVLVTVVVSVAGAVASALLTVGALGFEVASATAVVAILVQSLWLHRLSRGLRGTTWSAGVVRLGRWAPVAQAVGAAVVLLSLALPWGSAPQVAVLVAGVALGLPAWAAWPVWFVLAAREVGRHGVPGEQDQQEQQGPDQQQTTIEEEPCPPLPASTTSR